MTDYEFYHAVSIAVNDLWIEVNTHDTEMSFQRLNADQVKQALDYVSQLEDQGFLIGIKANPIIELYDRLCLREIQARLERN